MKSCFLCGYPLDVSTGVCEPCGVTRVDEADEDVVVFTQWVQDILVDEQDDNAVEQMDRIQAFVSRV